MKMNDYQSQLWQSMIDVIQNYLIVSTNRSQITTEHMLCNGRFVIDSIGLRNEGSEGDHAPSRRENWDPPMTTAEKADLTMQALKIIGEVAKR